MTPDTHKPCCEKPRKTVSVSTKWGRRPICNSCGADWKEPVSQKEFPAEHHFAHDPFIAAEISKARKEERRALQQETDLHIELSEKGWYNLGRVEALRAVEEGGEVLRAKRLLRAKRFTKYYEEYQAAFSDFRALIIRLKEKQ